MCNENHMYLALKNKSIKPIVYFGEASEPGKWSDPRAGKAGAIVGAFGFSYASQSQHEGEQDKGYPTGIGLKNSFLLLSIINAAGFFMTFFVPETNGVSLEDLSGESTEDQTAYYNGPYTKEVASGSGY